MNTKETPMKRGKDIATVYSEDEMFEYTPVPRLNLPGLKEVRCLAPRDGKAYWLIDCEFEKRYRGGCPKCGSVNFYSLGKESNSRIVHDVNVGMQQVDIRINMPRYKCNEPQCGKTFMYPTELFAENHNITNRLLETIKSGSEHLVHDRDLSRVDDGFAVKSHGVDELGLFLEAFHIIQICIYGVKALYTCGSGGDDHLLTCAGKLDSGERDMCLQILGIIPSGEGDTDKTLTGAAYLIGVDDAEAAFDGSHEKGRAFNDTEFSLCFCHGFLDGLDIPRAGAFRDADDVGSAGNADTDILLPVGSVKAVYANDPFHAAVIDLFKSVIKGKSCGVLLVFRYSVLKVEHDGVGLVNIRLPDQSGFLTVEKHHGSAKPFLRLLIYHLTAPPQGIFA